MTREEAIFCEKTFLGETNCVDCKYYGRGICKSRESHKMSIKALEQEPILDKIRADIEEMKIESNNICFKVHNNVVEEVLRIINKYREESEEE